MIPEMTDPLGLHWDQPKREEILVDDQHAIMSASALAKLSNYSMSIPTGAYVGKMWKRLSGGVWWLCWYGEHPDPTQVSINTRKILAL